MLSFSASDVADLRSRQVCVTQGEPETAYSFAHPLNVTRTGTLRARYTGSPDEHWLWQVNFENNQQSSILDGPLSRSLYTDYDLHCGTRRAAVVVNARLVMHPSFRGQGFARALYAEEEALYRRWGVKEIHIDAVDDGLVVWLKKFGFLPYEPEVLAQDYADWAPRNRYPPSPPSDPADYPDAFLRSRNRLQCYRVI